MRKVDKEIRFVYECGIENMVVLVTTRFNGKNVRHDQWDLGGGFPRTSDVGRKHLPGPPHMTGLWIEALLL